MEMGFDREDVVRLLNEGEMTMQEAVETLMRGEIAPRAQEGAGLDEMLQQLLDGGGGRGAANEIGGILRQAIGMAGRRGPAEIRVEIRADRGDEGMRNAAEILRRELEDPSELSFRTGTFV